MSTLVRELEPKAFQGGSYRRAEYRCACGATLEIMLRESEACPAAISSLCRRCQIERDKREDEQRRSRERAERTASNIPARFPWATLAAPELPRRVKPPSLIEKAAASIGAAMVVGLFGPTGAGKTSLACALLRAKAEQCRTVGHFVNAFELAEARRQARLGQGEAQVVERAMRAGVLLLDELGAERSIDTAVAEVVAYRHDNELPLIFTSGFSREALAGKYGGGIDRRLFEGALVLRLGAQ